MHVQSNSVAAKLARHPAWVSSLGECFSAVEQAGQDVRARVDAGTLVGSYAVDVLGDRVMELRDEVDAAIAAGVFG